MEALISVIVPIFNVEMYLHQCVDSIVAQSYTNLEIILVDDGSTDNSASICDEYAVKDKRVRVIHKPNEGLVRARKDGLMIAGGDFIAYVDGDDWIEPSMIKRLYDTMVEEKVDLTMCGRYEDTGDVHKPVYHGIQEGRYDKQALIRKVYPNMIVNGAFFEWGLFPGVWDKLFKREKLEKFQMIVEDCVTMGEDAVCTYPCLLNADSIYVIHECLYHYRQTRLSMVKRKEDKDTQRKRFRVLYNSGLKIFERYKDIYDLREQWKEYLLFLMVPRAEELFIGIEKLNYLFPFKNVKKGSNIILYGMGIFGQNLYRYIERTGFCNVLICVDKNYEELRKQGVAAEAPDAIINYEYDAIVVANSFASVRNAVYRDLTSKYPGQKVQVLDEGLIKCNETLRAFGLI